MDSLNPKPGDEFINNNIKVKILTVTEGIGAIESLTMMGAHKDFPYVETSAFTQSYSRWVAFSAPLRKESQ